MNMSEWRKNFDELLSFKMPPVSNYEFIDDYVRDVMHHYRLECAVKKEMPRWYRKRLYKHEAISKAEAYGLTWRNQEEEKQYLKEKDNIDGN